MFQVGVRGLDRGWVVSLCASSAIAFCLVPKGTAEVDPASFVVGSVVHPASVVPEAPQRFTLIVRAVGGEGEVPVLQDETTATAPPRGGAVTMSDPRIEDLSPKLRRFPFTSFRLIAMQEQEIALMKRETIHLSNGHTLCVRPLSLSDGQLTLWMRWNGEDGMSILDTRLQFSSGEPMIAGFEGKDATGLILAVQVLPQER